MNNYRVYVKSTPGPYRQIDGFIDVTAESRLASIDAALLKLRQTSFPDRDPNCWHVNNIERL